MMTEKWRKNAVLRFWSTYLIVILLLFGSCSVIMHQASCVVKDNIVSEYAHLLQQGAKDADTVFTKLNTVGMQLSLSPSLQNLSRTGTTRDSEYYRSVNQVLDEYGESIRFLNSTLISNTFIYLRGMDRVIYDSSVYRSEVFQLYADKWGVPLDEWLSFIQTGVSTPYFHVSESGELFYIFPCLESMQDQVQFGSIVFHISREIIGESMNFLDSYSRYSLFTCGEGKVLTAQDSLGCRDQLNPEWLSQTGEYRLDHALVFSQGTSKTTGLTFVLVIPEQEAMTRLSQLQWRLLGLALLALLVSAGSAYFFSVRTGAPVNRIALALQEDNVEFSTDLKRISNSVCRLVLEQKQDKPALINSFFHNLLKGNFVSQSELAYMADRAGLTLTGNSYRAAALRLFPQIDPDEIDGATVEAARALQNSILDKLHNIYSAAFWAYKRNVLVHLFVLEQTDPDLFENALNEIVSWLNTEYHVQAFWGIGTVCQDLLLFWRSSEEALAVADLGAGHNRICYYSKTFVPDDTYSLSYAVEEHLVQGIRTGNRNELHSAIDIIHTENFARRSLNQKQFLKLNQRISEILSDQTDFFTENDPRLKEMKRLASEPPETCRAYFSYFNTVCDEICNDVETERARKRDGKMASIIEFIRQNYENPDMGLAMCSTAFHFSEGYLSMLFKAEMKENFADYLERIRITAACEKLKSGMLVADVAKQTGYNSAQSFRRAFKRVMGISPSEYRQ